MNNPFRPRAPAFDAQAINETIQRALASAGLDTSSGPMHDVTQTIRNALQAGGLRDAAAPTAPGGPVIDVVARVIGIDDVGDAEHGGGAADVAPDAGPHADTKAGSKRTGSEAAKAATPGSFERHQFSNRAGTLAYKLYMPLQRSDGPQAMVVMLHGCTQSADDFATGTRMNRLAEEHGFLVVYPEQSANANASKCWNWFKPQDQARDAGEPSLIAGMVCELVKQHGADPRRIFVAGLSAGAAMAVVLGEAYPELFAGVGAHSGLPYRSAHDIPSAMAAMKGGRSGLPGLQNMPGAGAASAKRVAHAVPTIVFHGDRDHTVQQSNGIDIVDQAQQAHEGRVGAHPLNATTQRGTVAQGRSYTRTVLSAGDGAARVESWVVNGAGHAWSGGDPRGTFTDRTGPDASAEMVRFFLALPRGGAD